jgi:hypothetical protein
MLTARLSFDPDPVRPGEALQAELTVENRGRTPLTLVFTSAQTADLEVGSYRWSEGRLFAAVMREVVLAPGVRFTARMTCELDLPAGAYVARARLAASGASVVATARLRVAS